MAIRITMLIVVSIAGGAVLGSLAAIPYLGTYWASRWPTSEDLWFGIAVGSIVGAPIGLFTAMFVVPVLVPLRLRKALPVTYIPAIVSAIFLGWMLPPGTGIAFFGSIFGTVCALGIGVSVAALVCPIVPRIDSDIQPCSACSYSLRGNTSGVCPECGSVRESQSIEHRLIGRRAVGYVWMVLTPFLFILLLMAFDV
jgi:hypothetical protein